MPRHVLPTILVGWPIVVLMSIAVDAPVLPGPPTLDTVPDQVRIEQGSFIWVRCSIVNNSKRDLFAYSAPLRETGT